MGDVYTDLGFENTWDVTRAQPGSTPVMVNGTGDNVAGGFSPSTPYSNASTNPAVAKHAASFLTTLETVYPGITATWNG